MTRSSGPLVAPRQNLSRRPPSPRLSDGLVTQAKKRPRNHRHRSWQPPPDQGRQRVTGPNLWEEHRFQRDDEAARKELRSKRWSGSSPGARRREVTSSSDPAETLAHDAWSPSRVLDSTGVSGAFDPAIS